MTLSTPGAGTPPPLAQALNAQADIDFGQNVIRAEGEVLTRLANDLGDAFAASVEAILELRGRVVVTGMGKAGLIGKKICATLASTGTPSFFLHPAEAMHGDLGMVASADLILALSNSGETEEILRLLPHLSRRLPIIAITRDGKSPLAQAANWVLELGHIDEVCPLGLAPSASTTAMLAMGDALALAVERRRGFSDEDFARFHPRGSLGKRFQPVSEAMRTGSRCPIVKPDATVFQAMRAITTCRAGSAIVVDERGALLGIFTDGDFRRHWTGDPALGDKPVGQFMTSPCVHVGDTERVSAARAIMAQKRVNELPVVDAQRLVVGLLDIQDIVRGLE